MNRWLVRTVLLAAGSLGCLTSASPVRADERYFLVVFGAEPCPYRAKYTHTWATIAKLTGELYVGQRGQAAHNLHVLTDHIRVLYGDESRSIAEYRWLDEHCQKVWNTRRLVGERTGGELDPAVEIHRPIPLLEPRAATFDPAWQ